MKSFLICLSFIGTTITVNAQFGAAGQTVVGGSISFYSGKSTGPNYPDYVAKNTGFNVSATAGKFTKKNVLSSFALSYGHSFAKQNIPSDITKSNLNSINAVYSKTYFKEVAKKIFLGIGGSVSAGYNAAKITYTQNTDWGKSEGYSVRIGIAPILAYQFSNRVVINCSTSASFLSLNYSYAKTKYYQANQFISTGKSSSVNFDTGFFGSPFNNLSFGFSYLLKHK